MCAARCRCLDRRALLIAGAAGAAGAVVLGGPTSSAAAEDSVTHIYSGTFEPQTFSWHYLPVEVPAGVNAIEVSYDYERTDTGAGFSTNVIDIGIFDESGHELGDAEGFRGWSGGARRRFRVATDTATPGYLAGPIDPGTWHVILGPVGITPPGLDWTVTVTLHFGEAQPTPEPTPPPRKIARTGEGWYRGDLHLHTVHSDGTHTQESLVVLAREAGLDFIGSSEHNTSSAPLSWGEYVDAAHPPLVLAGEEVTTRNGHWIAMGVPPGTWIDWRYEDAATLGRFADQVRGLGGLAIACHPWVPIPMTGWGFGYDFAHVDAVELWNGPWTLDDNHGVEWWHDQLVAGTFLPAVGSSDSHRPNQTVGEAHTVVRASTLSTSAIIDGLRSGRSWLAESSTVDVTFEATAGGRSAGPGDSLGAGAADVVDVRLEVTGAAGCIAQAIGPAGPVAGGLTNGSGRAVVTAQVPAAGTPFVRAEVRRLDDEPVLNPLEGVPALPMVALTNPIRLSGSWG